MLTHLIVVIISQGIQVKLLGHISDTLKYVNHISIKLGKFFNKFLQTAWTTSQNFFCGANDSLDDSLKLHANKFGSINYKTTKSKVKTQTVKGKKRLHPVILFIALLLPGVSCQASRITLYRYSRVCIFNIFNIHTTLQQCMHL